MQFVQDFFQNIISFVSNFAVAPRYIQAGVILVLIFLLIVSLAQFRQHFVKWSMKGGLIGLFFGVVLTLILEGFLLISGRTALISLLSWRNAPKPVSTILDIGKEKFTNIICTP